jgi:hypothetical protein
MIAMIPSDSRWFCSQEWAFSSYSNVCPGKDVVWDWLWQNEVNEN